MTDLGDILGQPPASRRTSPKIISPAALNSYERPPREGEINGYCVGDRVAVVSGPDAGKNGHVTHLSKGCYGKTCWPSCTLVYVLYGDDPEPMRIWGVHPPTAYSGCFPFSAVTHVD